MHPCILQVPDQLHDPDAWQIGDVKFSIHGLVEIVADRCRSVCRVGSILKQGDGASGGVFINTHHGGTGFQHDLAIGVKLGIDGLFVKSPGKLLIINIVHHFYSGIGTIQEMDQDLHRHLEKRGRGLNLFGKEVHLP